MLPMRCVLSTNSTQRRSAREVRFDDAKTRGSAGPLWLHRPKSGNRLTCAAKRKAVFLNVAKTDLPAASGLVEN